MVAVFGSAGPQSLTTNLIYVAAILLSIYIFIKFCGWAKSFQLPGTLKKVIFLLTGVGLVVFNVLYSQGNTAFKAGDSSIALIAVAGAMVWVFVFAFALMAENKPK